MSEGQTNHRAIEMLDSWMQGPVVREIIRREWYVYRGWDGGCSRYPLPAFAVLFGRDRYRHGEFAVIVHWWAWKIQIGYVNEVHGAEPVEFKGPILRPKDKK